MVLKDFDIVELCNIFMKRGRENRLTIMKKAG